MNMLQTVQDEPIIHNSSFLLEKINQGPIALAKQSEPVAVIVRHDIWMKLVGYIARSEFGHDLQLLPASYVDINDKTKNPNERPDNIDRDVEQTSSQSSLLVKKIPDRDRMLAALKSMPPMSDENAEIMDRLIQEAREASIDHALLA